MVNVLVFISIGELRVIKRVQVNSFDEESVYMVLIDHDYDLAAVYWIGNSFQIITDPDWLFYEAIIRGNQGCSIEIWK